MILDKWSTLISLLRIYTADANLEVRLNHIDAST